MGADGRTNVPAILRDLIARPAQLSRLVRIACDAFVARSEMQRVRQLLGPHFGLTDVACAELGQAGLAGHRLGADRTSRLTARRLKQIEFSAQHEIETAGAPFAGSVAHQRRLFAIAPHDRVRPRRLVERLDDQFALFGGRHIAERHGGQTDPRGDPARPALGRFEDVEPGFRRQDAMGAEAADRQDRRVLVLCGAPAFRKSACGAWRPRRDTSTAVCCTRRASPADPRRRRTPARSTRASSTGALSNASLMPSRIRCNCSAKRPLSSAE